MSQELVPAYPIITKETDIAAKFLNAPAVLEKLNEIMQEEHFASVSDSDSIIKNLEEICEKAADLDPETKEGYEAIKTLANRLVKVRTGSKKEAEEIAKPFKDAASLINGSFKSLENTLQSLEEPLATKYKDIDKRIKEQKEAEDQFLRDCLSWFRTLTDGAIQKTSSEIEALIDVVSEIEMGDNWKGYLELAMQAQYVAIDGLTQMLTVIIQKEQAEAEMAKLKAEQQQIAPEPEESTTEAPEEPPEEETTSTTTFATSATTYVSSDDFSRFTLEDLIAEYNLEPGEYQLTLKKV